MKPLDQATARLRSSGIPAPRQEAKLLLGRVLGEDARQLLARGDTELAADQLSAFMELIERRCDRVPLSHLLGRREFWSLEFSVNADVLDPRPDSETIVEAALAQLAARDHDWRARAWRILDLGTGSGCLLLALLHECENAVGLGVDRSEAALAVARSNAQGLGLASRANFQAGDWAAGLNRRFDLVVSNPPYIATGAIAGLMPEVAKHEPRLALDGGADGLDAYRQIAPQVPRLLEPGGVVLLEIGAGQAGDVGKILAGAGVRVAAARADLAGRERVLIGALEG